MPVTERDVVARALWSLHGLGWRLDAVYDETRGLRSDCGLEERRVFLMRRPGVRSMFGPARADVLPFEAPLKGRAVMESPLTAELRRAAELAGRGECPSPNLLREAADEIVGLRARLGQANARLVRLESQAEALLDVVEELGGKFESNNEKAG